MALPPGTRAELIRGELLMSPSPEEKHQTLVGRLHVALSLSLQADPVGKVFLAPFDVHLPSGDVVEPDLVFVAAANLGIVRRWIHGVPDLLIEVVSPEGAARDRLLKRDLYARNGVPEFWLADPDERSLERLVLERSAYAPGGFFSGDDVLTTPRLPRLELRISSLFPA